jgi:hypothetical protein
MSFWLLLLLAPETCARCHRTEATAQPHTAMAHALESAEASAILQSHPELLFRDGRYAYRIQRSGIESVYSVSDGDKTITAPLRWAFGRGAAGQTYVYEYGGAFYESRVSFYNAVNGLDLTMGAANAQPASLEEAAGRKMSRGPAGNYDSGCAVRTLPRFGGRASAIDEADVKTRRAYNRRGFEPMRRLPPYVGSGCGERPAQHVECAIPALPPDEQ